MSKAAYIVDEELFAWFEQEGMLRYRIQSEDNGEDNGEVSEEVCAPMIALGPGDEDWVWPANPDQLHYPWKRLRDMTLDDFNNYMYRWFEEAVQHGVVRCAFCGKQLIEAEDLPDADTWDALLIEKELVGWLAVHFDCKKQLPKKLKGLHPFGLQVHAPPHYDLAHVPMPTWPTEPTESTTPSAPPATDLTR